MFRYTFFLENDTQGWSETFFRAGPFESSAESFLTNYVNRRLELLASACKIVGIRASNTDRPRDIIVYDLPHEGRGGAWALGGGSGSGEPGIATYPEDTFTAILLRLTDGAQHYRTFQMLGMPDHIFAGNRILPSEQALVNSRLNNWIQAVTLAGFGMKLQGAPSATGRIVQYFPKTPTNQLVCLGLKGPIPAVDTLVTLGSVKPFNALNRTWRVAATDPADPDFPGIDGWIYLAGSSTINTYGPVEGGKYKVPTYTVAVLNGYTIGRMTPRKTGVPFTTVRGRR